MLIIILHHKNGGTEMKVKLCVLLTRTQTRFSFAVFSKVAMVTPAGPPSSVRREQMSGVCEGPLRAVVWEDELSPTQEMNAIKKHDVCRAEPMNATCPQSLER